MIWQDLVIALMTFILALPAIKMLFEENKPSRQNCLFIAGPLLVETVVFSTIGLWLTTALMLLNVVSWGILSLQRRV